MITTIITLFVITCALGSYYYFIYLTRWAEQECRKRGLKRVPIVNPLWMMFKKIRSEELMDSYIKKNGKVFAFTMGSSVNITIIEPELLQIVLAKEFTNFMNRRRFVMYDKFMENALSMTEGEKWKRIRSIVTPTFSSGKLRRMKPLVDESLMVLEKNILSKVAESNVVDVKQVMGSFSMETIMRVAFGVQIDSLSDPNHPIIEKARKIFSFDMGILDFLGFLIVFTSPRLAKILGLRFSKDSVDYFYGLAFDILKKKRAEMKQRKLDKKEANDHSDKPSNFIELLLEAEEEARMLEESESDDSKKAVKYITNDEMLAQCTLFLSAGYETTATAICLACYYLALNPTTQQKLYEEIIEVLQQLEAETGESDPHKLVTFESLSKFQYVTAVIDETLRLSPPATVLERRAERDMTLETSDGKHKIFVKNEDVIHIPVWSLHRDPDQFPDPEQFNPERFMTNPTFHHKFSHMPFGNGPRNCVAKSLAMMEAKMALLHTVRMFRLSVCEKTSIPLEYFVQNAINVPKDVFLKVESR